MSQHKQTVVVIGAGPVGLYAAFQVGLRGMRPVVIDAMPSLGGQCAALYPERAIYDAPAIREVRAGALVDGLAEQLTPFEPIFLKGRRATSVWGSLADGFTVETDQGDSVTGAAVIFAGGAGALRPRPIAVDGLDTVRGDVSYAADLAEAEGRNVAVFGDGGAAIGLALDAAERARSVSLIHAAPLRAETRLIDDLTRAAAARRLTVIQGDLSRLHGANGRLEKIELSVAGQSQDREVDLLLVQSGLEFAKAVPTGLTPIADPATGETGAPGVFIIGDAVPAPSRPPVIAAGFSEAVRAAEAAFTRAAPDLPRALPHTATSPTLQSRLAVA